MTLIDRHLIRRFLANFAILFALVYLLATAIDLILQLDEFMQAVERLKGKDPGVVTTVGTLAGLVWEFHGPRVFQLYAYLLGVLSVGAASFTLAQMLRHRETVALLASGMSLYRLAWPLVIAAFGLNLLHVVNSNVVLPSMAPLLIRSHGDLGREGIAAFPVPFTADRNGALLHAPAFHRDRSVLERPTILVRDALGRTATRITAEQATWDAAQNAWRLTNGRTQTLRSEPGDRRDIVEHGTLELFATDLTPEVLVVRRYAEFAQMLSPSQIGELMRASASVDQSALARIRYGRYAVVFTNMLLLLLCLPFFLLRLPGNLLPASVKCAGAAVGVMLGSFILMEVPLAGIPAAAGVFMPVAILIPLSLAHFSFVRT